MSRGKLFVAILSIILFYSCSSKSTKSEKFIGRWINLTALLKGRTNSIDTILIAKVGQNFTFTNKGQTVPASYNKELDKLEVTDPHNHQKIDFIYDPKTDNLIGPNIELARFPK